jgi:hypothetical protein
MKLILNKSFYSQHFSFAGCVDRSSFGPLQIINRLNQRLATSVWSEEEGERSNDHQNPEYS